MMARLALAVRRSIRMTAQTDSHPEAVHIVARLALAAEHSISKAVPTVTHTCAAGLCRADAWGTCLIEVSLVTMYIMYHMMAASEAARSAYLP